jgi:hypothetical protein
VKKRAVNIAENRRNEKIFSRQKRRKREFFYFHNQFTFLSDEKTLLKMTAL